MRAVAVAGGVEMVTTRKFVKSAGGGRRSGARRGRAVAPPRPFAIEQWADRREVTAALKRRVSGAAESPSKRAHALAVARPSVAVQTEADPDGRGRDREPALPVHCAVQTETDGTTREALTRIAHAALRHAWNKARRTMKCLSSVLVLRVRCYDFGVVDALFPGLFVGHGPRGGKPKRQVKLLHDPAEGLRVFREVCGDKFGIALPDHFHGGHFEVQVDEERPVRITLLPGTMSVRVEMIKAEFLSRAGVPFTSAWTLAAVDAARAKWRERRELERKRKHAPVTLVPRLWGQPLRR